MSVVRDIYRSAGFYPITGLYTGGVVCALFVADGEIDLPSGLIIFAFLALTALLLAAWKEVRMVHHLVDSQRAELLARIDELSALLVKAGVVPPLSGQREQDARDDIRREDNKRAKL